MSVGQQAMLEHQIGELVDAARLIQGSFALATPEFTAAAVAAALRSRSGVIYTGVCAHLACGLGFCAEQAAIAEMLKNREVEIAAIVAVDTSDIVPPCGRCRELMAQLSPRNAHTQIILSGARVLPLHELLPEPWLAD